MFGFGGFYPGFGLGVLPSYYPFLAANGWGRCGCYSPFPYITPFPLYGGLSAFSGFPISPVYGRFRY
jgi:hypothetical protein